MDGSVCLCDHSTRRTRLSTAPNVNVQMEVLQVVMDSRMKAIMAML